MKVDGKAMRPIWLDEDGWSVRVIDQRSLPHVFETLKLTTCTEAADAIRNMVVRGAPLIGATAAYGICLAIRRDPSDEVLEEVCAELRKTRPTAINLRWAIDLMFQELTEQAPMLREAAAYAKASEICEDDVATNRAIGEHGLEIFRDIAKKRTAEGRPVTEADPLQVLTHCNAGWLACVDWGTATAPMYLAQQEGLPIHVWVDETRPRNQGAGLTSWELGKSGIPHTLIVDNAGGHLMQHGRVDLCIVGTDRVTASGDVCNKIGTYLKALAAHDNEVPFYVALPSSTIDWTIHDGVREIPIEERAQEEVTYLQGWLEGGKDGPAAGVGQVRICPADTKAANFGFDVTPARLVTGLITERGVCAAGEDALRNLFNERAA